MRNSLPGAAGRWPTVPISCSMPATRSCARGAWSAMPPCSPPSASGQMGDGACSASPRDPSEAEIHWRTFLDSPIARGMRGVRFIVSDDHAGLTAARRAVLPGAVWQRCQFHLAQNAIHHAPNAAIRKRIGAELRRVWNASSLQAAQEELDRLVAAYHGTANRLADWLEHDIPEGFAVFTLPEQHRRRMRTANPIERAIQQEIKRRTSKVRVFPNRGALLRLATAVLVEIDEEWATSDRVYINWHSPDA